MAMPSSGTITFAQLQTEFGGSNPIGLNEYYRGGSYVPNISANASVPTSGAISLSNFYSATAMSPITVSSNWGTNSTSSPVTSATRTMTVPSGNPGTIRFVVNNAGATGKYSKNGGTFTAITDGMTLSIANGDTIALRANGSSADVFDVAIYDHTLSTSIGTWVGTIA